MAEIMQSLDQLGTLKPAAPEAPKYVQKIDKQGRAYATGKRKNAVARVWIKPGKGTITVNTRSVEVCRCIDRIRNCYGIHFVGRNVMQCIALCVWKCVKRH